MQRRAFLTGSLAASAAACAHAPSAVRPGGESWVFDSLAQVGGHVIRPEGAPTLVDSPWGAAVRFDGQDDALFVDAHPLAGAATFTFEALFRPEGGAFEQRWFHLQELAPETGAATDTRILFEIRTEGGAWWLDAFAKGPGYNYTLITPEKRFPVGQWFHVAQSFDGSTYRSFVDGELQAEARLAFQPQGHGAASIGCRYNRLSWFKGAVRQALFTRQALPPERFSLNRR
jgi:hypothetical protein